MTQTYPTNAQELLDSKFRGKDDFFLLCRVEQNDTNTNVIVEPDFPIAVNKEAVRDQIFAETGIKLPTRKEVSKKELPADLTASVDWDQMYTAATGAALWLRIPKDDGQNLLMTYLIKNSADKPVNPNKFNFPSGLVCDDLVAQAFTEINQETGILIPCDAFGGVLVGVNFILPKELPALNSDFKSAIFAERNDQEGNIRGELQKYHPDLADKTIIWANVDTNLSPDPMDRVSFNLLGKVFEANAHVVVDDKAKSANIHFPLIANFERFITIMEDLNKNLRIHFDKTVAVDPEQFHRNVGLYTIEQAKKLDTIPAPNDYFKRLAL